MLKRITLGFLVAAALAFGSVAPRAANADWDGHRGHRHHHDHHDHGHWHGRGHWHGSYYRPVVYPPVYVGGYGGYYPVRTYYGPAYYPYGYYPYGYYNSGVSFSVGW